MCPACERTSFTTSSAGMIFKKTIHVCTYCGTTLEQSGKGENAQFKVTKVGEAYSNAATLLEGKRFLLNGLGTHENVISDADLESIANGNLDNVTIQMAGDTLKTNVILKKDEKIMFYLSSIDYLEERSKRVSSGGGGFSFRVTKGVWYRTPALNSPQYANVITQLDSGVLILTNKRYIFTGSSKNIDVPFTKITSIDPYQDGVGIARANKQRTEIFTGSYHWPLIISIITGFVKRANS